MRKQTIDKISETYKSLDGYVDKLKGTENGSVSITIAYCTKMIIGILVTLHKELVYNIPMPEEK